MRWEDYRQSDNLFDRRGEGGSAFGGGGGFLAFFLLQLVFNRFGFVGVIVVGAGFLFLSSIGVDPLSTAPQSAPRGSEASIYDREIGAVLATTEDVWDRQFQEKGFGPYQRPALNLFSGGIQTQGCGFASAAVGPFYCPGGRQIYIDTAFFDQLDRQLGAPGDFARAYVIAHEVGHHIQTQLGLTQEARRLQARAGSEAAANEVQVRIELMADCLAGVWARQANRLEGFSLEEGDIQEGLRAAAAIGDDTLQRRAGGRVVPDSFTHGSSAQRQRWLQRGFEAGDLSACDTFAAERL